MNDNCDYGYKKIKESVCIDVPRIYDSCADKDCLADIRVYFTDNIQDMIDNALSVRCRGVEVINVNSEVERVPFNRGFYSVDLTFYFNVHLEVVTNPNCPSENINGLAVFTKKCILYGSEGNVRIFTSEISNKPSDDKVPFSSGNPRAKIQVAEPICLDAKLCRPCDCCSSISDISACIPSYIRHCFCGQFVNMNTEKAVRVTIGLFTIVQLERDVQMLVPVYDFCMPEKECSCDTEDPCDSFRKIKFPVNEFFPPSDKSDSCDCRNGTKHDSCGCSNK